MKQPRDIFAKIKPLLARDDEFYYIIKENPCGEYPYFRGFVESWEVPRELLLQAIKDGGVIVKPKEKPMPKEKVSEYRFKVNNEREIDKTRICRENTESELIIVIPKHSDFVTIFLRRDLDIEVTEGIGDRKRTAIYDRWNEFKPIQPTHFKFTCVNKSAIPIFLEGYRKMKSDKKSNPKQEVVVKCFGGVENTEKDICKNCHKPIHKSGGYWWHENGAYACHGQGGSLSDIHAEPNTLPF